MQQRSTGEFPVDGRRVVLFRFRSAEIATVTTEEDVKVVLHSGSQGTGPE